MDRKGGVLSLKKKKKILDFFLVLFTLKCLAYESLRLVQNSGTNKNLKRKAGHIRDNDFAIYHCRDLAGGRPYD
jgi:hypothetical protein